MWSDTKVMELHAEELEDTYDEKSGELLDPEPV